MCGIAGILTRREDDPEELSRRVGRMAASLQHRGPDDVGAWIDPGRRLAMGFRRLAILDLSVHGHQPMTSASGRYVMVFNGEIYNHRELRRILEARGHGFRGHSDTEVILAAFEEWGPEAAVPRFVGMFAIGLWDAQERVLLLVRDRLGIKPLYVYSGSTGVLFASELKALVAAGDLGLSVDPEALGAYFRYLYVPAPLSIYREVRKLRPGHILRVADGSAALPESQPYWSLEAVARKGLEMPFAGTEREAVDEVERLIADATRLRTYADVPVGAFLSGGVDSSTVVALMQKAGNGPVKTFTVTFDVQAHDEGPAARAVATALGTDHTEVALGGSDVLELVPRITEIFDEPFADPSQLPTYLVSQVARRDVTVCLSGDGGDEVFGGYNRYTRGVRTIERAMRVAPGARRLASRAIGGIPYRVWERVFSAFSAVLPTGAVPRLAAEKVEKLARLLPQPAEASMYRSLMSAWENPAALVRGGPDRPEATDAIARVFGDGRVEGTLARMMLSDQIEYLPDDLLAKVDRASMAVSLEVRVPILDHRVVELAWALPPEMKIRDGTGKWLLREVLFRHVPKRLVDRPKVGFTVPVDDWLHGPLRPWAEALLSRQALERSGLLHVAPIERAWKELKNGRRRNGLALWTVIVFQAWYARWVSGGPSGPPWPAES